MATQFDIIDLELSVGPYNALRRAGIENVYQLILAIKDNSIMKIRNIGNKSYREIVDKLCINIPDFTIDSDPIAALRTYQKNLVKKPPEDYRAAFSKAELNMEPNIKTLDTELQTDLITPNSTANFFEDYFAQVRKLFDNPSQERNFEFLCRRFGLFGSRQYTLDDIGKVFGVSRERVRQIERDSLLKIKRSIKFGSGRNPAPIILQESFRKYKAALIKAGPILLEETVVDVHNDTFEKLTTDYSITELNFVLTSMDFSFVTGTTLSSKAEAKPCWITDQSIEKSTLHEATKSIFAYLQTEILPVTPFDLLVTLNKRRKKPITISFANIIITLLGGLVNIDDNGNYQIEFLQLRSIADQAYRILHEHNSRLTAEDIAREINKLLSFHSSEQRVNARSLVNQLTSDSRFKPVGKRGWVLTKWPGYDHRPIVDRIKELMTLNKSPMSVDQITTLLQAQDADISEKSIRSYLAQKSKFTRISENEYALPSWKLKPFETDRKSPRKFQQTVREVVKPVVINYLEAREGSWVPLSEVMAYVEKVTQCNHRTLYTYISEMPEVIKEKRNRNLTLVKLITSDNSQEHKALLDLIEAGESNHVEFKSTLRWNIKTEKIDSEIENAWLKTVVGFLNTDGGTLFVGIDDEGHFLGLSLDSFSNTDKLLQYIGGEIKDKVGGFFIPFIKYQVVMLKGNQVLVLQIQRSSSPAFLKTTKDIQDFYVRTENDSKVLQGYDMLGYITNHFTVK